MNRLRPYLAVLRGSIQVGLVYRLGFLFTILGNIYYMAVAYFLWKSIYGPAQTMHGMTFDEAFLYVALGSTIFILLKTYAEGIFPTRSMTGGSPFS
jgi:viologen exporter family transport system permease protein